MAPLQGEVSDEFVSAMGRSLDLLSHTLGRPATFRDLLLAFYKKKGFTETDRKSWLLKKAYEKVTGTKISNKEFWEVYDKVLKNELNAIKKYMNIITHNPYRVIGILSNATAREIQSRKGKIQAFTRVGKEVTSDYDFSFLEPIHRTEEQISKAFSDIEQNPDKVKHSLFWFINHNNFDQIAIENLKKGETGKAKEIWHKIINNQEVNAKNFSAYNNLSTLWICDGDSNEAIVSGVQYKLNLINSDYFKNFAHLVADETFTVNPTKQTEMLIDSVLSILNNIPIELLSRIEGYAKTYLTKKFTEEPIHTIETAIEKSEEECNKNKKDAYNIGVKLYNETKVPLSNLKNILGVDNLQYQTLADSVAKQLLICGTTYWNNSNEEDTDLEKTTKLSKLAQSIAVGKITKDKVAKDLETLSKMKDRALNNAIVVLEQIKKAYENAIILGNTLKWDLVTKLIIETIPEQDVEKIRKSTNTQKLEEYKALVDFIIDRSYSSWELAYLRYWRVQNNTSTSNTTNNSNKTTSKSAETTKDDDFLGCMKVILIFIAVLFIVWLIWGQEGLEFVFGAIILLILLGLGSSR